MTKNLFRIITQTAEPALNTSEKIDFSDISGIIAAFLSTAFMLALVFVVLIIMNKLHRNHKRNTQTEENASDLSENNGENNE